MNRGRRFPHLSGEVPPFSRQPIAYVVAVHRQLDGLLPREQVGEVTNGIVGHAWTLVHSNDTASPKHSRMCRCIALSHPALRIPLSASRPSHPALRIPPFAIQPSHPALSVPLFARIL